MIDTELETGRRAWRCTSQRFEDVGVPMGSSDQSLVLSTGLTHRRSKRLRPQCGLTSLIVPPSRDHALAWIVYSAELGYRYSGDEYWQTFERETPGWSLNGDRYRIRDFYHQFQRGFGGAEPSGAWAKQFSIICWPITHAILPKDLQRQLARTLYESRHFLSGDVLGSPESLGDLIAARSWNATSRFQNLAEETRLVGQIAAALLFQGRPARTSSYILRRLRGSVRTWTASSGRATGCGAHANPRTIACKSVDLAF